MPFDALLMLCKNLIKFDTQLPKIDANNLFKYNIHSVKLQIESNGIACFNHGRIKLAITRQTKSNAIQSVFEPITETHSINAISKKDMP